MVMATRQLQIVDPETDICYSLTVSLENFVRAQTDETFLSSLLAHATSENGPHATAIDSEQEEMEQAASTTVTSKTINTWTYQQTIALIQSMETHEAELHHPQKRQHIFENIMNDLLSQHFDGVTEMAVKLKWESLVRSYTKAKDTKTQTGQGPSRFHFFEMMDDVLGNKPSNKCTHTLNSMEGVAGPSGVSTISAANQVTVDTPETQSFADKLGVSAADDRAPVDPQPMQSFAGKATDKKLKREYLRMKAEEYNRRQRRHEERMAIERERIDVENRKLQLLQDLLKK